MAAKNDVQRFGVSGKPLVGNKVMIKAMEYFKTLTPPIEAFSILVFNFTTGQVTGANVYNGEFGSSYDPAKYTNPIPGPKEKKRLKKMREYSDCEITDPRLAGLVVAEG
jgi:hypothetical protein